MDLYHASDGRARCGWVSAAPEFLAYHDTEWGFPVTDDLRLFEKICLEGFQSGLSWRTILAKRDNFRAAFSGFDFHSIKGYDQSDVERLLSDEGIVRHRGKIEAVVNNARRAIDLEAEMGSLAAYFWSHEPSPEELDAPQSVSKSPASVALSKELKERGWKFVGPTTVFAFMQAMGLVNDHAAGCFVRNAASAQRAQLNVPLTAPIPNGRRPSSLRGRSPR